MKYYLSSMEFGNQAAKLKNMLHQGAVIGHINNAQDSVTADMTLKTYLLQRDMLFLEKLGFVSEHLDLKDYFDNEPKLRIKLAQLDGIWVAGGNTFILRQAMKLSGFDNIFPDIHKRKNFLWGGYSAGVCILCDSLRYITLIDNPKEFPYSQWQNPLYDGLGAIQHGILPHYDHNQVETDSIKRAVKMCIENRWLFKIIVDGEVIIGEDD